MSEWSLPNTQQWLMTLMASQRGGVDDVLHQMRLHFDCHEDDLIKTPNGVSAASRLQIYSNGYLLRLLECLRADFPATRNIMGCELFDFFATAFIVNNPSHSTTLFDLGERFPKFLSHSQRQEHKDSKQFSLPIDLARLERARINVIRAKGLEGEDVPSLPPFAMLSGVPVSLRVAPCLQLLSLDYPLVEFLEAVDKEPTAEHPAPEARQSFFAITRKHFHVGMHYLEPWQYEFLSILVELDCEDGVQVKDCIQRMEESAEKECGEILARLSLWLSFAVDSGLVYLVKRN